MRIIHTEMGCTVPAGTLPPLATLMVFDPSEVNVAEQIVSNFVEMYKGMKKDALYYSLVKMRDKMRANMPERAH